MGIDAKKGDGIAEAGSVLGEAIGAVVIGEVNPVGMSRETFSDSPDLLFHGAGEEFEWRRDFDYAHKDANQHSQKAGRGFYATPSRADAVLFSEAFGAGETPVVLEMLPHKAKVFDFRVEDKEKNANVPEDMLGGYIDYCKRLYEEKWGEYGDEEDREFIDAHADEVDMPDEARRANPQSFEDMFATIPSPHSEEKAMRINRIVGYGEAGYYLQMLESHKGKGIDLREMLSLDGNASNSEYASDKFRNFMLEQGYDGIIYIEGGDHPDHVAPVSYVFYNLEKIGTYDAWNSGE